MGCILELVLIELNEEQISKIKEGFFIPSKPEILTQIQKVIISDEPKVSVLADIIAKDIGLASAIFKTINSPVFGFNRKISNIKQAVMFLGLTKVEAIITCLLLKDAFKGESCISLERFWDNSNDVANAMLHVGQHVKAKVPLETLYTVGLFHDCGVAAMSIKYSDYKDILTESNNSHSESLVDIEDRNYKTNHACVGFHIATTWHLPKEICELILNHHALDFLQASDCDMVSYAYVTLKAAENMVESINRHRTIYDWSFIKEECLQLLGITDSDYDDSTKDFVENLN